MTAKVDNPAPPLEREDVLGAIAMARAIVIDGHPIERVAVAYGKSDAEVAKTLSALSAELIRAASQVTT